MKKTERVRAALSGDALDRPPFSFWTHLPGIDLDWQRIAEETLDIYAPIANRLGMSKIKNELEELCFKSLEEKAYESLKARVDARVRRADGLALHGVPAQRAARGIAREQPVIGAAGLASSL